MKSIRNKLLTGIILINSLILIGICIFNFGFEKFYIKRTSIELNDFGKRVEELILNKSYDDMISFIYENKESKNINIDIYDKNNFLVFTNYEQVNNNNGKNNHNKKRMHKDNRCQIVSQYEVKQNLDSYIIRDKFKGSDFLATINTTSNNEFTIITQIPISAIENSVDVATNFLFMIFVPIIATSIFIAIYFSYKFTKPIIELNELTNKIANLNFDEKVNIKTEDEIGILGCSINTLSSKINDSIKELESKNKELENLISYKEKQEKLRKEFVSSVSHELKTPITIINGYAQGIKNNILENEEDKQYYIDVICEESEKMGIMVNDILDLYKLESKTFKMKNEKVNLKNLIKNVCKKHELIIKEKNINLNLELNDLYTLGDKIRLEQVLNNLIDNAINHVKYENEIRIDLKNDGEYISVDVYNSGDKINNEDIEKIWYSFVRLDKVRSRDENRVGLGLAIVREIVNLHFGYYSVENINNGVLFKIKLKKI